MFKQFKKRMQESFKQLIKNQDSLFIVEIDKEEVWNVYLDSFTDPEERQGHDCNCCKSFIRQYSNIVAIVDGEVKSIWDFNANDELYQPACDALNKLIISKSITNVFITKNSKLGTDTSKQITDEGNILWNHFHINLPTKFVSNSHKSVESLMGIYRDNRNTFTRALDEITIDSIETVLELIAQKSLYLGPQHKEPLKKLLKYKKEYKNTSNKKTYTWIAAQKVPVSITRIRTGLIGTLLVDLTKGVPLDDALDKYNAKADPTKYKRAKEQIKSKKQLKDAEDKVKELGLVDSLARRFACAEDVSINDILYVDRDTKRLDMGIFDELAEDLPVSPKSLSNIKEIGIEDFMENVLPTAKSIELLFENHQLNNLTSLITSKNKDTPSLFKWDNPFCWCYSNGVTDSIKQRVTAAGGRIDVPFRFSHSWNHDKRNASLMDLHVFLPGSTISLTDSCNNIYGNNERIGWNNRNHSKTKGSQDVDYTAAAPIGYIPVENTILPDLSKLKDGDYICKIHNWQLRQPTKGGFKAEIALDGQIYEYEYDKPLAHKEWITVAIVTLKNGVWSIKHKLPHGKATKTKWGIETNKFHKVSMVLNSPNYWGGKGVGNKHFMFIMENAKNDDEEVRGFFNEFLKDDLRPHRHVFEVLSGKMKVDPAHKELSGVGFSESQPNHFIVKVQGKFESTLKVTV